jgi:hypothetical protein
LPNSRKELLLALVVQRGVRSCPRTESLKWLAEHRSMAKRLLWLSSHDIREALVSEQSSDEECERPLIPSQRPLTLLRAEHLLALAGGQGQKRLKVCLRTRRNSEAPFSLLVAVRPRPVPERRKP